MKKNQDNFTHFGVKISIELSDKLHKLAIKDGRTKSSLVRKILEDYVSSGVDNGK